MKMKFTLLNLLCVFCLGATAQDITGIWRGYFVQNAFGIYEDRYKFEIQIEQVANNAIKGVTYSYKTTVFFGKADLQGMYTKKTKNLVFQETKLFEVKIGDESVPCLMTCYLDLDKMGKLETLSGTYTSKNLNTKADCGSGKVFLEKVPTSDFYKEDFLVKRENEKNKKKPSYLQPKVTQQRSLAAAKPKTTPPVPAKKIKPGAEGNLISKEEKKVAPPVVITPKVDEPLITPPADKPLPPRPDIIKKRQNDLVRTITTAAKEIKIQLYDNGDIDGDTISVYHNNELVISRQRLTDKPITFTIKANEGSWKHEFVMVANNLGAIPPNTALMVLTAGDKRYELFISSNEQKNAVVELEYKP